MTDSTSTPVPGVGHDYIKMMSETVNPANGSVSVRIGVPMPPGRKLTIPFSFAYDSNGAIHPESGSNYGTIVWYGNVGEVATGGWSYSVPSVSEMDANLTQGTESCYYSTDYVFQDPSGGRHPLYVSSVYQPNSPGCQALGSGITLEPTGTDGVYQASLPTDTNVQTGNALVVDPDGTVYTASVSTGTNIKGSNNPISRIASQVEDRNGNFITINDGNNGVFSYTDTLGRAVLSSSGFGSTGNTARSRFWASPTLTR